MAEQGTTTPRDSGMHMPAEWSPHAATLMAWPSRRELWNERLEDAQREYSGVANAIADFEPVIMICNPGEERQVRDRCGQGVEPLAVPIDDSWLRDSGPRKQSCRQPPRRSPGRAGPRAGRRHRRARRYRAGSRHLLLPVEGRPAHASDRKERTTVPRYRRQGDLPDRRSMGTAGEAVRACRRRWAGRCLLGALVRGLGQGGLGPRGRGRGCELEAWWQTSLRDVIGYRADQGAFRIEDVDVTVRILAALVDRLSIQLTLGRRDSTKPALLTLCGRAAHLLLDPGSSHGT